MKPTLFYKKGWPTVLPLIAITALPGPLESATYRWTDNEGNVVYSQTPPPDGRNRDLIKAPPPPAEPPDEAQQKLQQQIDQLQQSREARQQSKQQSEQTKQQEERLARDCASARNDLKMLREGSRRLYRRDDGTVSRLTETEKNTRTQQAETFIKENCRQD